MKNLFASPAPVGNVKNIPEIKKNVDDLVKTWEENKLQNQPSKFRNAANFILHGVDHLVLMVDNLIPQGSDKKATVISYIIILYDKIVYPSLPIWMKPFAFGIKTFIIDIMISILIDFIVKKYHDAEWIKENTENVSLRDELIDEKLA